MKRLFCVLPVLALLVGCSGQSTTAPSTALAPSPYTGSTINLPRAYTAACPAIANVTFDPTQLGRVTITNTGTCATDYLFIIWRANPADPTNQDLQVNVAQARARVLAGQTETLTLGVSDLDCAVNVYQRDVYAGVDGVNAKGQYDPKVSYSDVNNAPVYAPGVFWQSGQTCGTPDAPVTPPVVIIPPIDPPPPPPPPVDSCETNGVPAHGPGIDPQPCHGNDPPNGHTDDPGNGNDNGNNGNGGGNNNPPPPPVDVCPNIAGDQATVPVGLVLVGNACQPVTHGHGH